jgi:hypothetical protein
MALLQPGTWLGGGAGAEGLTHGVWCGVCDQNGRDELHAAPIDDGADQAAGED